MIYPAMTIEECTANRIFNLYYYSKFLSYRTHDPPDPVLEKLISNPIVSLDPRLQIQTTGLVSPWIYDNTFNDISNTSREKSSFACNSSSRQGFVATGTTSGPDDRTTNDRRGSEHDICRWFGCSRNRHQSSRMLPQEVVDRLWPMRVSIESVPMTEET